MWNDSAYDKIFSSLKVFEKKKKGKLYYFKQNLAFRLVPQSYMFNTYVIIMTLYSYHIYLLLLWIFALSFHLA